MFLPTNTSGFGGTQSELALPNYSDTQRQDVAIGGYLIVPNNSLTLDHISKFLLLAIGTAANIAIQAHGCK
jgi:hypothetical protein